MYLVGKYLKFRKKIIMKKNNEKSMSEWDKAVPFFQLNDCTIGKELTVQLLTGIVDEKRYVNHDKYWTEKLMHLDNAHTCEYNLHIDQVDESIANISQYLSSNNEKKNTVNGDKLTDCYKMFKTHEYLMCNDEVKEFIQRIDKFMYKATRPDSESDSLWKKRTTYAELFNHHNF